MATYTLDRGLVLQSGQTQWQVQRLLEDGYIQLENTETGRIRREKISRIFSDVENGKYTIVRDANGPDTDRETSRRNQIACIESLPEKYQKKYLRALGYVRQLRRLNITRGQRSRISEAVAAFAQASGDKDPPKCSTVMLWMRQFDTCGANPYVLVSGNVRRDRRKQIDGETRRVVDSALRRHYFVRDGCTLRDAHDRITATLEREAEQGHSPEEGKTISLSTVRRIAQEISPYERDRLRLGPTVARAKWRFSKPGRYATRPLERVEMDHTLLDIWVIDDTLGIPLGRPTITFIVCSYSAYILGFFISFEGETIGRVVHTIKTAIQPKDSITADMGLVNRWHSMGLWETLVLDNAMSFHSPHLHKVAADLCMDLEYCPVRMPWFKPVVERHLGALTRQLPASGRPQKPGRSPDPVDPKVTACITFSDLCSGILQWVVDIHPFEINQRKLARPVDLFLDGLNDCPAPRLVDDFASLDILSGMSATVTVDHSGIVHKWLQYADDELSAVRREVGTKFKAVMKYDPYDLGRIFVQHPKTRTWITVQARDQDYAAGLTLTQHQLIRRAAKEHLTIANAIGILRNSRLALKDRWTSAARSGKNLRRSGREFALLKGLSSLPMPRNTDALDQGLVAADIVTDDERLLEKGSLPTFETFSMEGS